MKPETPISFERDVIFFAASHLFNLLDNSIHLIPAGKTKDRCREAMHQTFLLCNQLKSGDACRHPVQSPDVVGQGGTNLCYQCDKRVDYLFADSRCKDCTRLTIEEVQGNVGQGGAQ